MGMLTSRRLRERQAQEAAGLPPSAPRPPDEIPYHEHGRIVRELQKAHSAATAKLSAENAELRATLEQATAPKKSAGGDVATGSAESATAEATAESTDTSPTPRPGKPRAAR